MKTRFSLMLILSMIAMLCLSLSTSGNNSGPLPTSPVDEANISISTDGLMAMALGNPDRASIGILRVEHHTPQILITKIVGANKTTVATIGSEQLRRLDRILMLTAVNHQLLSTNPALDNPADIRQCIDLETDIAQKAIHLREDKLTVKIHLSAGLIYADDLSAEKYRFIAADNSGKALTFNRRAGSPAIKLNLNRGQALTIKGDNLALRLVAEDGVKYQIAITNVPPANMAAMDHFLNYFAAIEEKTTPYQPLLVSKASFSPHPIICLPVICSSAKLD